MDNKYDSLEPFYVEPQKKYELINRATEQLDRPTFHNEPGEETVNGVTNYTSILPTYIQPVDKYETLNPQKVEPEKRYYNRQTQKNGENLSYPIPGLEAVKYDEIEQHDQHLHSIDKQCVTEGRGNPEVPHDYAYIGNKNIYEDLDNIEISYSIDAENAHSSNSEHKIIKKDVNVSTIERNLKDKKEFIKITITKKTCLAVSIPLALLFLLALIGGMVYYFYFINAADSTSETNTDFPINITTQETTILPLPSSSTDDLETTLMPLPTNIIYAPCINITCYNNGSCHEMDIGSLCECPVGFEEIFCEIEIDECASSPCQNDGTCLDKINGYECSCVICECADKEAGPNCEVEVPCTASLCQNGGSCDANIVGNCICIDGYVGQFCEMVRKTCQDIICANGGTCIDDITWMDAVCSCAELFTGVYCETNRTGCDTNPCLNGGICTPQEGLNYTCECRHTCSCANDHAYAGERCEVDRTTCAGKADGAQVYAHNCSQYLQCYNNGDGSVTDCLTRGYVFDPTKGYCSDGATCYVTLPPIIMTTAAITTTASPCIDSDCLNGGVCDASGVGNCICQVGFIGETCDIPRINCTTLTCKNGGTCDGSDTSLHAMCMCSELYTGQQCETEINPCDSTPCLNGGTCVRDVGLNYTCQCGYTCQCANDYDARCKYDFNTCASVPNGNYPHPTNCSKYLLCKNNGWSQIDCQSDLVFDYTSGLCNFKNSVPCAN